jgi:hypothetical protein
MLISLYSPFYSFFSLYTHTSDYNSRSSVLAMFRPFFIIKASLIWPLAFKCLSLAIAVYIASALLIIKAKEALNRVIHRYTLNTSRVGTSPFGPTVSFTTLTTIYRITCLSMFSSFNSYYCGRQSTNTHMQVRTKTQGAESWCLIKVWNKSYIHENRSRGSLSPDPATL